MKKPRFSEEQVALRVEASRVGNPGGRRLPADRRLGGHVPHLEEEVCRPRRRRAAPTQSARGRERTPQGLKRIVADLTLDREILQEVACDPEIALTHRAPAAALVRNAPVSDPQQISRKGSYA